MSLCLLDLDVVTFPKHLLLVLGEEGPSLAQCLSFHLGDFNPKPFVQAGGVIELVFAESHISIAVALRVPVATIVANCKMTVSASYY